MVPVSEVVLTLEDIQFGWLPEHTDVRIERLQVRRAERVLVLGESGSGKSTLLNLIAGVMRPWRGIVSVLGHHINELKPSARDRFRAEHYGIIFQQFNLLSFLSPIENVSLPCRFSKQRRDRAILRAGSVCGEAARLLDRLGIAEQKSTSGKVMNLSVGQQQRVAVARALIGRPDLVLADEPTSALDARTRDVFMDLLVEECKSANAALVFVSHDEALRQYFHEHIRVGS